MEQTLRYHQAVFELLGLQPSFSAERQQELRELEERCGRSFPASIVEWFSLEDAHEIFAEHTTPDELAALAELGDPEVVRQGYMLVATENQGVVAWYARLTGADDPPIYDNHDQWEEELALTDWRLCAQSFSSFVLHKIGVTQIDMAGDTVVVQADDAEPDAATLEHLYAYFTASPHGERPGRRRYSFFNQHARMTIIGEPAVEQGRWAGRWVIEAASAESLETVLRGLWPFGRLATTLRPKSGDADTLAQAEAVLARLRG